MCIFHRLFRTTIFRYFFFFLRACGSVHKPLLPCEKL